MDKSMTVVDGNGAVELSKSVGNALERCDHATKIWTHSRSGMMLRNMTIGGEYAPMRRMRQVAAEIQKKRTAMVEAKYNVLKKKKEAQLKRQEAKAEKNKLKREYLEIEAEEIEVMAALVEGPYLGAMREVIELSHLHDSLEAQIREKYGKFDEEVFEKEEAEYWVSRSFTQSLRDIRQHGVITSGQQELLEQIGFDPCVVHRLLVEFLTQHGSDTNPSSEGLEKFISECSRKYSIAAAEKMKRIGLPPEVETSHLMLEETS